MLNEQFVVAIKDGNYISIDKFHSGDGKKCKCFCPDCGEPVQSNITSKTDLQLKLKYTNHFSHLNINSNCSGGFKETEIHLFAKSVIDNAVSICVPSERYHYPDHISYKAVRLEPSFPIHEYKQFRPDIIITSLGDENLAIEVFVTNDLTTEKINLYQKHQFKCLKIDLSDYYKKNIKEVEIELKNKILHESKNKKWIWPVILNELDKTTVSNTSMPTSSPPGCMIVFLYYFAIIGFLSLMIFLVMVKANGP